MRDIYEMILFMINLNTIGQKLIDDQNDDQLNLLMFDEFLI